MVYMDMCFCNHTECKRREECYRALENHKDVPEDVLISLSEFRCDEDFRYDFFIPNR